MLNSCPKVPKTQQSQSAKWLTVPIWVSKQYRIPSATSHWNLPLARHWLWMLSSLWWLVHRKSLDDNPWQSPILGNITLHNHQPTGVLKTAHAWWLLPFDMLETRWTWPCLVDFHCKQPADGSWNRHTSFYHTWSYYFSLYILDKSND